METVLQKQETQERGWRAEARKRRLENIDEITLQLKLNLDTFRLGHLEADQLNKPACGKEPLE